MTERAHTHILLLGLGLRVQFRPFSPRSLPYLLQVPGMGWRRGRKQATQPRTWPSLLWYPCLHLFPSSLRKHARLNEPPSRRERRGSVGVKLSVTGVM